MHCRLLSDFTPVRKNAPMLHLYNVPKVNNLINANVSFPISLIKKEGNLTLREMQMDDSKEDCLQTAKLDLV